MATLSKKERTAIKNASGLIRCTIIKVHRDSNGYPNYLIEGQDHSGEKFRGWWYEGEGASDIRWDTENVDGWPANLT